MHDHLNVVYEGVEEHQAECPFCGGAKSLQFNDVKGVWICFKCGEKGTAKYLAELLNGTYREPDIDLDQISDQLRSLAGDPSEPPRVLHDGYLLRYISRNGAHQYWRARGFDEPTCARWELGHDPLAEAATLPFRDPSSGHLAGVIFRVLGPTDGPRYKFPAGFPRNRSLHGSWLLGNGAAHPAQPVVLAEGPTDAIRIDQAGHPAVAQYGSSIGSGQVRLLHRLGVRELVLFYDYDRAGLKATERSSVLAEEFFVERVRWDRQTYCWHSSVCGCPSGHKKKDIWQDHTYYGNCPAGRECRCGRIHEPDPCSLSLKEIDRMLEKTVAV
jgi:DNA primase